MSVLVSFAWLMVVLYTLYCGLGLWMAQHVAAIERGEEPMQDEDGFTILDHLPKAHIEIMQHYYSGMRGILWRVAFLCLVCSLFAVMASAPYSVHLFALALGIDCILFITYEKKQEFLAQTSVAERMFDFFQYSALLAALMILLWRKFAAQ